MENLIEGNFSIYKNNNNIDSIRLRPFLDLEIKQKPEKTDSQYPQGD